MKKTGWLLLLLLTCWLRQGMSQEATLPEPSTESQMVPLQVALDAVTTVEQKCIESLTKQETLYEEQLRTVAVEAAAAASRPLLAKISGLEAEVHARNLGLAIGIPAGTLLGLITGLLLGLLK